MKLADAHLSLVQARNHEELRRSLCEIGAARGFDSTLLALVPGRGIALEKAVLISNYAAAWRTAYDEQRLVHVDPTVRHCIVSCTPLIWSPEVFASREQMALYEAASAFGLRSGITLPIHGPNGEVGILCFVRDQGPGPSFVREIEQALPELCLLRDFAAEAAFALARRPGAALAPEPALTPRERECLQWAAAGKSSWETAQILRCSEATINFHIANVRRKFDVSTRREAVVKAVRIGLVSP